MKNDISITPSVVMEYLYCPRFIYYMLYLKISQNEENRYKVMQGRNAHTRRSIINKDYLRKKIGVEDKIIEQKLYSAKNSIHGIVDEILFLKDGTAASLDYKFSKYKKRTFLTHKYQAAMYGLMIADNYHREVNKAYIVYIRSKNKLIEINLTADLYQKLEKILIEIIKIIQKGIYPAKTKYKNRCFDCTYRNICIK
ncbi:CRISPR-associated protein Cas4 [Halanaerobium salsuginis]|jgi:CRISPR-associated exonuclease Cas4|uniref:CRISPR-associated exonuclease Cas4 n=1 Tax=Halanaerobium salsuginis TaxID=29563 RepID=A0A1I4M1J3_9FIRM|nr:CRISPR-associated protein Cas4 [Halanaerobium salsuginis]SFL97268.1 CRISPR-associated exonuclease, Cas4 family [Halanaerobium salsuginis]